MFSPVCADKELKKDSPAASSREAASPDALEEADDEGGSGEETKETEDEDGSGEETREAEDNDGRGEETQEAEDDAQETEAEAEAEAAQPQAQRVVIKSRPSLHRYQGLKGYVAPGAIRDDEKVRVVFPSGAPTKTFRREQVEFLARTDSMVDRLTEGTRILISRGPGEIFFTPSASACSVFLHSAIHTPYTPSFSEISCPNANTYL